MKLKPKKWSEFQHYKNRSPSWIKLHAKLLDDVAFQRLPRASQALAPMLWLIAREQANGIFDANTADLAFRLRWPEQELADALQPLIEKGFFEVVQSDSAPLAQRKQDAMPEREVEVEREVEKETQDQAAPQVLAPRRAALSREELAPPESPAGRIAGGEGSPSAQLGAVLKANSCRGNAFHPTVIEWAQTGVTVDRLQAAIAIARQRPGKEAAAISVEYIAAILRDPGNAPYDPQEAVRIAMENIARKEAQDVTH